ncbi:MAG: DNA (cytosine-5-)-methyltransferase [Anaerolineae bacterium]
MGEFTVIDLFCGAGGFSEGFRQQGFKIVAGLDSWRPAIDTFNYNFGLECEPRNMLEFAASTKRIEALPDTDVIIGSPPCTSFSSSNKSGKGDKTMGRRLTKIFLRIIAIKKHKQHSRLKAWFMENVSNSTSHLQDHYTFRQLHLAKWALKEGLDPDTIAVSLKENRSLLNAADFGVPQSRGRVFTGEIVPQTKSAALRKTHRTPDQDEGLPLHVTLAHIMQHLPKPNSERSDEFIADPLYSNIKIKQTELTDHFYDTGLYARDWKGSQFLKTNHPYMGPMSFPEREDRPSRTVTATKIGNSREALIFPSEFGRIGNGEYRTPTIREAAILMGFPITFQFLGSEGIKWKLVGNAVCPPVSRALAKAVRVEFGCEEIIEPQVITNVGPLAEVPNLNTFKSKSFDKPPVKKKGSRFRRHPFKLGNLTVTLSNYDIEKTSKSRRKWKTSVQYGTGEGFPIQRFPDGYFKRLEPVIMKFEGGSGFIDIINNGFSHKVAGAKLLQEMYEAQSSKGEYLEPTELVDALCNIIEAIQIEEPNFEQNHERFFRKKIVPKKQVMALYGINKICSIANGDKK